MKKDKLLELIEQSKSNREIAKILGCCAQTVAAAKKRLGISDLTARKRAGRKPKFI